MCHDSRGTDARTDSRCGVKASNLLTSQNVGKGTFFTYMLYISQSVTWKGRVQRVQNLESPLWEGCWVFFSPALTHNSWTLETVPCSLIGLQYQFRMGKWGGGGGGALCWSYLHRSLFSDVCFVLIQAFTERAKFSVLGVLENSRERGQIRVSWCEREHVAVSVLNDNG